MIEEEVDEPVSNRCQLCVWSGDATITTAFVVVDCGRHETPGVECKPRNERFLDELAIEGDRITALVHAELAQGDRLQPRSDSYDPDYKPEFDHDTDTPFMNVSFRTRDARRVVALLDEAGERIRYLENDLAICRGMIRDLERELTTLRSRVRR